MHYCEFFMYIFIYYICIHYDKPPVHYLKHKVGACGVLVEHFWTNFHQNNSRNNTHPIKNIIIPQLLSPPFLGYFMPKWIFFETISINMHDLAILYFLFVLSSMSLPSSSDRSLFSQPPSSWKNSSFMGDTTTDLPSVCLISVYFCRWNPQLRQGSVPAFHSCRLWALLSTPLESWRPTCCSLWGWRTGCGGCTSARGRQVCGLEGEDAIGEGAHCSTQLRKTAPQKLDKNKPTTSVSNCEHLQRGE